MSDELPTTQPHTEARVRLPTEKHYERATKPDAQGFDDVRFVVVPRYKTSGLSGDEWRINVMMQLWRKGKLIFEDFAGHDMEAAMSYAGLRYAQACDDGYAYFAGEGDRCDQESCSEKATVVYKLKKKYCCRAGGCGQEEKMYSEYIRMFCQRHSRRGDCGREDADDNYEFLKGYPIEPRTEDKKPSIFGGVIVADSLHTQEGGKEV